MGSLCHPKICAASARFFLRTTDEFGLEVEEECALGFEVVENPSQAAVHAVLCLRARFHYRMQNQIK